MTDYSVLYLGTSAMILLALFIIAIVIVSQNQFAKQRKFFEGRDKFYIERIGQVENLVKTEFVNLLKNIKNDFT